MSRDGGIQRRDNHVSHRCLAPVNARFTVEAIEHLEDGSVPCVTSCSVFNDKRKVNAWEPTIPLAIWGDESYMRCGPPGGTRTRKRSKSGVGYKFF